MMLYIRKKISSNTDKHGNTHPVFSPGAVGIAYGIYEKTAQVGLAFWAPTSQVHKQKVRGIAQTRLRTSPLVFHSEDVITPRVLVSLVRTLLIDAPHWEIANDAIPHSPSRKGRVFKTTIIGPDGVLVSVSAESRIRVIPLNEEGPKYDGWLLRTPKWVRNFVLVAA